MVWTDDHIVESIRSGEDDGLVYLYRTLRRSFLAWAGKQYGVDDDLLNDAFQEAIIAMRHNIIHGQWSARGSSLKTYLFSIGKNQLLNRIKKTKYEFSRSELVTVAGKVRGQTVELTDRQELVRAKIARMQNPCKTILKMFYYLGYSMEVIAARMDYKSEDVAKSQKLRCLKKLKLEVSSAQES